MSEAAKNSRPKVMRENLFLHVALDGNLKFIDVTRQIGSESPYRAKVRHILQTRSTSDTVAFAAQQVTKASRAKIFDNPLSYRPHIMKRIEEKGRALAASGAFSAADEEHPEWPTLVAVIDGVEHKFAMQVEPNGLLTLHPQFNDSQIQMPPRGMRIEYYMNSSLRPGMTLCGQFIGNLDTKPGADTSFTQAVAKAIRMQSAYNPFQLLSGIGTVNIPTSGGPSRPSSIGVENPPVKRTMSFDLFTEVAEGQQPQHLVSGPAEVEILTNESNPGGMHLLMSITPGEELKPHFDAYQKVALRALGSKLSEHIDNEEAADIAVEIVLGQLTPTRISVMQESLDKLPEFRLTPSKFMPKE